MQKVRLYRADEFYRSVGDLVGFFASKEEAESELDFSTPTKWKDHFTGSRITEFEVPASKLEGVSLSDTERILQEDIWGSGKIINDYYYI